MYGPLFSQGGVSSHSTRLALLTENDEDSDVSSTLSTIVVSSQSPPASALSTETAPADVHPLEDKITAEPVAEMTPYNTADKTTGLTPHMLATVHDTPGNLPDVRPCNVPAVCKNCTTVDSLELQLDWTSSISRRNINLPTNQKGYDNSETTVGKHLARRIQIFRVYFSVIIFHLLIFKTRENMARTKIDPTDLDSPR